MKATLKQLRLKNGYTQAEVAKQLKISRYRYRKMEQDPANCEFHLLLAIANLWRVKVTDIFLPSDITKCNVEESSKPITNFSMMRQEKEMKPNE